MLFLSCKEEGQLEKALDKAGENKIEFFKVLKHYSQSPKDSLKLEAAKFLIRNIPQHYSLYSEALLEMKKKLNESDTIVTAKISINTWWKELGQKEDDIKMIYDIKSVKAAFLIDNIDAAFDAWQTSPWYKEVSFDDFCKGILPYRFMGELLTEGWRDSLKEQYEPVIQGVKDVKKAFALLRDTIWDRTQHDSPEFPMVLDVITLKKQGIMNCIQGCVYLGAVARALGIPVTIDRVFQWANYSNQGHNWTALVYGGHTYTVADGDTIAKEFNYIDAAEFPIKCKLEENYALDVSLKKRTAKIWRSTFQINEYFPIDKEFNKYMAFYNSHYIDVSAEYGFSRNIRIPVKTSTKEACLCVYYSGKNWIPVAFSHVENGSITFKNVAENIVYLPMKWTGDTLLPIGNPILLLSEREKELNPDKEHVQIVRLTRKYPFSYHWTNQWGLMKGARFEASNDSTFRHADVLYTIGTMPVFRNEIQIDTEKKYRYIRYVSPEDYKVPLAELQFVNKQKLLQGQAFGKKSDGWERCFDGDTSTLVYNKENGYSVGLDLKEPQSITQIIYFPKNNGNFVIPEHEYEWFYYDGSWISLGQGRLLTKGFALEYGNVPENSLLLLKDCTSGQEERIFTYENDKQVWW